MSCSLLWRHFTKYWEMDLSCNSKKTLTTLDYIKPHTFHLTIAKEITSRAEYRLIPIVLSCLAGPKGGEI